MVLRKRVTTWHFAGRPAIRSWLRIELADRRRHLRREARRQARQGVGRGLVPTAASRGTRPTVSDARPARRPRLSWLSRIRRVTSSASYGTTGPRSRKVFERQVGQARLARRRSAGRWPPRSRPARRRERGGEALAIRSARGSRRSRWFRPGSRDRPYSEGGAGWTRLGSGRRGGPAFGADLPVRRVALRPLEACADNAVSYLAVRPRRGAREDRMLKTLAFTLALAATPALAAPGAPLTLVEVPKAAGPATSLFNGQDLKDWDAWLGYADPALTYKRPKILPLAPDRRRVPEAPRSSRWWSRTAARRSTSTARPGAAWSTRATSRTITCGCSTSGARAAGPARDPGAQQRPALPLARRARRWSGAPGARRWSSRS